jgi:uncharacterized protein (DUF697 family)
MSLKEEQKETKKDDSKTEVASIEQETHDLTASNIVKSHIIASITMGLVPIPLFDLAALTATQMSMLRNLSEHYNVPFDSSNTKPLLTALVGGSLPVLGILGLSSISKLIPGVGSLMGSASLSLVAGAVTYAIGQVFILHFQAGGTLDDFDPKQAQVFFNREFESGKRFVKTMRKEVKANKSQKP